MQESHGPSTAATVPDDRPVRVEQLRLRRPVARSLAVGALSLPFLAVGAAGLSPDLAYRAAVAAGVTGGAFACVFLVRLQNLLVRAGRLRRVAPDLGVWVMWVLPLLVWVLPAARISRWDKAAHDRRSWTVFAWAALWAPLTMPRLWAPMPGTGLPAGIRAWALAVTAVVAFGLWAAVILRLARGAEAVAHESGVDA